MIPDPSDLAVLHYEPRHICSKCDQPVTNLDDACFGHERSCPNWGKFGANFVECYCSLVYHPECCPECHNGGHDGEYDLQPVVTQRRIIAIGRCENGVAFQIVSDPAWQRWQDEGAPSCGATWSGDYKVLPAEQREGYIGE